MLRSRLICFWLCLVFLWPLHAFAEVVAEDEDGVIHLVFGNVLTDAEPEEEEELPDLEIHLEEDAEQNGEEAAEVMDASGQKDTEDEEETTGEPDTAAHPDKPESTVPYKAVVNPSSASAANELTLSFLGDCCIGDNVKSLNRKNSMTGAIEENGPAWLFSTVSDVLSEDDFTFANLECTISDRTAPLYPLKVYNFVSPAQNREVLRLSGIDGMNTVNNHCIDFKYAGYEDTLANLEAVDIVHFGTLNPNREQNRYVHLGRIEVKGVRIGITGFSYPDDSSLDLISRDIQTLRDEGCDLVLVSLHWGTETKSIPNKGQFAYARKVLDAGADMIWGHHPHVVQPVYFYDGKPIFFSTGNFVFGTIQNLDPASGIFQLTWEKQTDGSVRLTRFHLIPVETRHSKQEYRPLVLEGQAAEKCLKHVIGNERDGFVRLPDDFAKTGTVYVGKDGSLDTEP